MNDEGREKIAVVSGRYPRTRFRSPENHRAYCSRHGYTYLHCNWPTSAKNPYFHKLGFLAEYVDHFDYLFWIDDDAFFLDLDRGLEWLLPGPESFLSICSGPVIGSLTTVISSGQFALRADDRGRAFLDAVRHVDLEHVKEWWKPEFGYFTGGDQDAILYLLHNDPRFSTYDLHEPSAFNSRVENVLQGDQVFLLHITGRPWVKWRKYFSLQRHLGRGPSLLPQSEAKRWNLQPSLPTRALRLLRRKLSERK